MLSTPLDMTMKLKRQLLSDLLVSLVGICVCVLAIGSWVNRSDHKFSKSRGTTCSRGILALNEENSHICCDDPMFKHTWVCVASFDKINPLFSSNIGAFLIPLIPLLINALNPQEWTASLPKRLSSYGVIIFIRVVMLYYIPMKIQDWLQGGGSIEMCWCKDFVSASKCLMLFDFSDHIVVNLVQYMLPCTLEIHYNLCELTQLGKTTATPVYKRVIHYLSIGAAVGIMLLNLRSMLLTCMFFHTFWENVVGFSITLIVVCLPLYWRPASIFWANLISTKVYM